MGQEQSTEKFVFILGVKHEGKMFSSEKLINYIGGRVLTTVTNDKLIINSLSNKPICEFSLQVE